MTVGNIVLERDKMLAITPTPRATWVTVGKSLVRLDAITYVSEVIDLGDCQVFFVHAGGLGLSVESSKKMSVQELNANRDALVKQLTGG